MASFRSSSCPSPRSLSVSRTIQSTVIPTHGSSRTSVRSFDGELNGRTVGEVATCKGPGEG